MQRLAILGGLTAKEFFEHYWQKKPLLIRQAIPDFKGLLTPDELAGLACEDDVQSRIVEEIDGRWQLSHGPFEASTFAQLPEQPDPKHRWTLLVQSVNHHLPEANALLRKFNFIPYARLDDLMVSYAPEGGGVGPHFDSYDVFLLQGQGKRLWRVSEQRDLTLIDDAPLRILKHFETAQEWLLEAGDMLYLPPHLAHWGIAVSDHNIDCMTYSIGFRAPKHQELATEFLGFLQDQFIQETVFIPGIYQDPDLESQAHPAEIDRHMVSNVMETLEKITWSDRMVAAFLGSYLSEPKPDILFSPNKKITLSNFRKKIQACGITLDLKSQILFYENEFYFNGEPTSFDKQSADILRKLADQRYLEAEFCTAITDQNLLEYLYQAYLAGYLQWPSSDPTQ